MGKNTGFTLSDKNIEICRRNIRKARPYTKDDPEPGYFDWIEDDDRVGATLGMKLLKAAGLWTAEDEAVAFGPHPPKEEKDTNTTE